MVLSHRSREDWYFCEAEPVNVRLNHGGRSGYINERVVQKAEQDK